MNKLYKESLEIRGIARKQISQYLEEIKRVLGDSEQKYCPADWDFQISQEEYFLFLQSEIPKVLITIQAISPQLLSQIIQVLRHKTFRAGG